MPLLEEAGLAPAHDLHIVSLALDRLRAWIDADLPVVPVSANLARSTLLDPLLARRLEVLLRERRLPACLLHLEVSEEAWRLDPDQLRCALMRLQAAGFSVAVDDFGVDNANVSLFVQLEFDVLKMDRSLIWGIDATDRTMRVVSGLASLCDDLSIESVAEGIETEQQLEALKTTGCTRAQGYLIGRPSAIDEFERRFMA